jgi:hypothetical protein
VRYISSRTVYRDQKQIYQLPEGKHEISEIYQLRRVYIQRSIADISAPERGGGKHEINDIQWAPKV